MLDLFAKVQEFHRKFGLLPIGKNLPVEVQEYRADFIYEEYKELCEAYTEGNNEKVLDALVDLVYVALGTADLHDFDFNEAFCRVHQANLKKQRADDPNESKRRSSLDVIKPKGWEPPYLGDLVV